MKIWVKVSKNLNFENISGSEIEIMIFQSSTKLQLQKLALKLYENVGGAISTTAL